MKRLTTGEFIREAVSIHGNRYDYSETEYTTQKDKVKIICVIHGEFYQHPRNHLHGHGCSMCSGNFKKTTTMYINEVKNVHGDTYDYSELEYTNIDADVTIICKQHGSFTQRALHHLHGCGCPMCCNSKGEAIICNWLNTHNVQYLPEYRFKNCKHKNSLPFDFYIPSLNMCIEYDGEHHFKPTQFNGAKLNIVDIQYRDKIKTDYCQANNIKLIRIPYTEFKSIESILENEMGSI